MLFGVQSLNIFFEINSLLQIEATKMMTMHVHCPIVKYGAPFVTSRLLLTEYDSVQQNTNSVGQNTNSVGQNTNSVGQNTNSVGQNTNSV